MVMFRVLSFRRLFLNISLLPIREFAAGCFILTSKSPQKKTPDAVSIPIDPFECPGR